MKKVFLSVMLAACTAFVANAQTVSFGVKGGLNISTLTQFDNSKARASIFAGGFANIAFNESMSLQPELLYSGQGVKYKVLNQTTTQRLNYINVPVMFQYRLIPEFFLEAGPQLGFNIASKSNTGKVTVDTKDNTKGVDFGLGFGLGYQFPAGVGIAARYMFGLSEVFERSFETNKNGVAQIGLFYTFNHHAPVKRRK
ncbi:porin family protein [Chitinophaga rhizophila]|uniref:PorT family protein n=1 Tax=Chitinophaga rhizophila TaxID=2866212 RepID=A0ABS7GBE2_9BACT|nr:porin family protein [Chitinophaga rhizophila]MBW8685009.1 PorT family protein [Chitinophaga rhizophila]